MYLVKVKLSDHFTYKKIFRAVIAPILMMLFISLYTVIDGLCVANFANEFAFAGVNLIYPITMIVGGLGFMFGSGGCALAGKYLGEKKQENADQVFSNIVVLALGIGIVLSIAGFFLISPIANLLGQINNQTDPRVIEEATTYGRILMLGQAFFILQNIFQDFFVLDEKSALGFFFSLGSGITNIVFDLLFIGVFKWGVTGAAIATVMGFAVGGIGPIIYFLVKKNNLITLKKCHINWKDFASSCLNGVSEFVSNIALNVVMIVFNALLLKYYAQIGVEAYGIISYVVLIFLSIFIGYNIGMNPIVSYHYGEQNTDELHNILVKSLVIFAITSVAMTLLGMLLARPIAIMYAGGDTQLIDLTVHAMRINSISFLFVGFCMFFSSWFTALNNGVVSAIISFVRLLVFQIGFVFLLSAIFQGEGIWYSTFCADFCGVVLSVVFLLCLRKKYKY